MRRRLFKIASLAILVVALGSHLCELFDSQDHTFQTGNDIESTLVIVALTLGAALAVTSAALSLFSSRIRCW